MCIAVPGQVVEIKDDTRAVVDYGGTRRDVNTIFVKPRLGDWVIVHAGFALQILDEEEARETLALWEEAVMAFQQSS